MMGVHLNEEYPPLDDALAEAGYTVEELEVDETDHDDRAALAPVLAREVQVLRKRVAELEVAHKRIIDAAAKAAADKSSDGGAYGNGFRDAIQVCGDISRSAVGDKQ